MTYLHTNEVTRGAHSAPCYNCAKGIPHSTLDCTDLPQVRLTCFYKRTAPIRAHDRIRSFTNYWWSVEHAIASLTEALTHNPHVAFGYVTNRNVLIHRAHAKPKR